MAGKNPIDVILEHEGGFVNKKEDRGGPTNFGITKRVFEEYLGRECTIDEIRNMKIEQAKEIYERNYLTGPRINRLPDPPMTFVLDCSVNHGPKNAIKMLQRVLNAAGFGPINVDGVLGPTSTSKAIEAQRKMGKLFQNALVEERIAFYNRIVANDPTQQVFLKGWLRRAESFRIR